MQALVLHGKNDLRFESNFPDPTPGPGQVLLRMTYASICQTDLEIWKNGMRRVDRYPVIQGHEAAGVVVGHGEGVQNPPIGTRVAVENVISCGTCFFCRKGRGSLCENGQNFGFSANGGLAELAVWSAANMIPLPDSVSDEEAPLSEPTTVAVHAVRRSGIQVGDTAAVIGCGVVGLTTLQVLQHAGAKVFAVDTKPKSLELAAQLGAAQTVDAGSGNVEQILQELTDGYGPDVVIETAGAKNTPAMAISSARRGGNVVLAGISHEASSFDFRSIVLSEKIVTGTVGADPGDYRKAVELIGSGKVNVKPLITSKATLERGLEDGFMRAGDPDDDVYRILVGNG